MIDRKLEADGPVQVDGPQIHVLGRSKIVLQLGGQTYDIDVGELDEFQDEVRTAQARHGRLEDESPATEGTTRVSGGRDHTMPLHLMAEATGGPYADLILSSDVAYALQHDQGLQQTLFEILKRESWVRADEAGQRWQATTLAAAEIVAAISSATPGSYIHRDEQMGIEGEAAEPDHEMEAIVYSMMLNLGWAPAESIQPAAEE